MTGKQKKDFFFRIQKELWYRKGEHIVDKSIPYLLIVLMVVIIVEIFFHHTAEVYHTPILIADNVVIWTFILDLLFKYNRVRKFPKFIRRYWLDILAVFPFYLLFRLFGSIVIPIIGTERFVTGQQILHEGLELEKEGAKIVREVEAAGKTSRTRVFFRFLRPLQRLPRFLKIIPFFERSSVSLTKLEHGDERRKFWKKYSKKKAKKS